MSERSRWSPLPSPELTHEEKGGETDDYDANTSVEDSLERVDAPDSAQPPSPPPLDLPDNNPALETAEGFTLDQTQEEENVEEVASLPLKESFDEDFDEEEW